MPPDRLPPLNSLRAFNAAARHMSFQDAAEELFVTPAALSYQIRQLEDHLGVKLFNRLNRAVELTEMGLLIAPGIREGFARLSKTMQQLERRKSSNVLVISAGPAITAKWLAPRLYRFVSKHPNIDARVSSSVKKVDLEEDDVDVAIRFGAGKYAHCRTEKLFDEYVTPMCSPALVNGDRPLRTPDDLKNHTLISDDTHVGFFDLADWNAWFEQAGVKDGNQGHGKLQFNVADHALDAAISGAGVVLGRTALAQGDLDAGRLVMPFDLKIKADFSFFLVYLESRAEDPNIRAFRDWLMDEIGGYATRETPGPAV
ncbi:MAG: transcriptional regulator GcvA [Rhodospirillales bacterium]|nr:transcriptional regulator GcvA [Rhodospirillales bacterium]